MKSNVYLLKPSLNYFFFLVSLTSSEIKCLSLWSVHYANFKQLVDKKRKFSYTFTKSLGKVFKVSFEAIPENYMGIFNLLTETYSNKKYNPISKQINIL